MNDLVVSIVSYNAADALRRCLRLVLESNFPAPVEMQVVVVDNGSVDGAPDVVRQHPQVRLMEPGRNLYYSGGNNLAWAGTDSRYFLILNSDCYVDPDAIAVSMKYLDDHPQVGGVTLRMAFESGELQGICARFQDRWYSLLWYTALGGLFPGWRARAKARVFYDGWDRTTSRPVEVVPDSYFMVRRDAFPDGLYDDKMGLYFTEDDLCQRLARGQWAVEYVAEARVVHPERTSVNKEPPPRIRAIFLKDLRAYYTKYEPFWYSTLLFGAIRASEAVRRALPKGRTASS